MTSPSQASQAADTERAALPVPPSVGTQALSFPPSEQAQVGAAGQPLPASGAAPVPADFRAKFAEENHQYIREYIRLADQKATFFFTGATALLAFLYRNGVSARWLKPLMSWNVLDVASFIAMFSLALSALSALWVVIPRTAGSKRGYFFWGAIAEYESGRQYSDELATLTQATLIQTKVEHCFELARVCKSKYGVLRFALWLGAIGVTGALLVFLFTLAPTRQP